MALKTVNVQCLLFFNFQCSGLASVYSLTRALKLLSTSEKIKALELARPCHESATLLRRYIFLVYTQQQSKTKQIKNIAGPEENTTLVILTQNNI